MRKAAQATCLMLLSACASGPQLREFTPARGQVELRTVPFYTQDDYQCGPAALAMLLGATGVRVTPEQLVPWVYLPERKGSLQTELVATARRYERVPYVIPPDLHALLAELEAGQPVLVLQNLRFAFWPKWHYAVVVGYDLNADELILNSVTEQHLRLSSTRFLQAWALADYWAMTATKPDRIAASADSTSWIAALSAFEDLGQPSIALRGYRAAAQRWPNDPLIWQAQANARYDLHDLAGAESALRAALALAPAAATRNNLAQILLERGCPAAAQSQIDEIRGATPSERQAIEETSSQIHAYAGPVKEGCHVKPRNSRSNRASKGAL